MEIAIPKEETRSARQGSPPPNTNFYDLQPGDGDASFFANLRLRHRVLFVLLADACFPPFGFLLAVFCRQYYWSRKAQQAVRLGLVWKSLLIVFSGLVLWRYLLVPNFVSGFVSGFVPAFLEAARNSKQ